jgi:hydrogenase-4 component B
MAGALLHAANHALFKGALFLGAGALVHETGTREIDRLGGLLARMPITGACLLAGSAAIAGLPPFNGFAGEFLLFLASFRSVIDLPGASGLFALAALVGLALAGGLAAACFLRLAGLALLGRPRSEAAAEAREPSPFMQAPMVLLATACLLFGFLPGLPLRLVGAVVGAEIEGAAPLAGTIPRLFTLFLALAAGLAGIRWLLLRRRGVVVAPTWDCGYERPAASMQYTASSFAQPIREMFAVVLPVRLRVVLPSGLFPVRASLSSEVTRPFQEQLYGPAFQAIRHGMSRLRWLHHGRVQLYVLYIVATLVALLAWFVSSQGTPR